MRHIEYKDNNGITYEPKATIYINKIVSKDIPKEIVAYIIDRKPKREKLLISKKELEDILNAIRECFTIEE